MTTAQAGPWRPADTLANRFRLVRAELGITQREMATKTGIPAGQIQGIEDGRNPRGLDTKVKRIALAYGVDRNWLMWGGELVTDPEGPGGSKCAIRDLNPEPADKRSAQIPLKWANVRHSASRAA